MTQIAKNRIISKELISEVYKFLVDTYGRSAYQALTPASPFVQLLNSLSELSELNFLYIENAISELNIATAKNTENIFGLSSLVGHNPHRGLSAKGKIVLKLKPDYTDFEGDFIIIPNKSKIICSNNGLVYSMLLDEEVLKFNKHIDNKYEIIITEGEYETQTVISTGEKLQSFSVITKSLSDHYDVSIFVNGEKYKTVSSLYDMLPDEKCVIVKTGINGGIDIYFGNGSFGYIPTIGSLIEVTYLKTVGDVGNVNYKEHETYFKFDSVGYDIYSDEIDLNNVFTITTSMSPTFGSREEDIDFTRKIAPYTSKNSVLVNSDNYYYHLKKYGYFSVVDVYNTVNDDYIDDDNIVYMFLIPDINKKLTSDLNYFTVNEDEFYLNSYEKDMILRLINESGQQLIGSELYFIEPIIKRYVLNIVVSYYDGFSTDVIKSDIINKINSYFLNNTRRDIIPRSDLIALIRSISGVDSVNVSFLSEENEKAIRNGYYTKKVFMYNSITGRREWSDMKTIYLKTNEDPYIGLNEFGDIKIEEGDLPILRGNWFDRNNKFYSNDITTNSSSVNIYLKDKIPYSINVSETNTKFKNMIK